jgi:hypothetical protein
MTSSARFATCENVYGRGDAGVRIAEWLLNVSSDLALLQKKLAY